MKHIMPIPFMLCSFFTILCMEDGHPTKSTLTEKIDRLVEEVEKRLTTDAEIIATLVAPGIEQMIDGEQPAIAHNKYKTQKTKTKVSNTISTGEKKYIQKREPHIRTAFEKHIPHCLGNKKTPIVTAVFSGGGIRATLGMLGTKLGLEKEDLLNLFMYTVTLSGSTWGEASLLSSKMSTKKFIHYACKRIEKPFLQTTTDEKLLIANMIAVGRLSGQPPTLVTLYGGLLGNTFLEFNADQRHMTYLSDQRHIIKSSKHPYPIYSAISRDDEWYAFTPHKVANLDHSASIPTYGCGRTYNNGKSKNYSPEIPLSILLGTFGAAFDADFNIIIDTAEETYAPYKEELEKLQSLIQRIGDMSPIPCELKLPNFTKGMQSPINDNDYLEIHDAGINLNMGYPAVSGICPERTADIIFFFDNSAGTVGKELQKCASYAKEHNRPFPVINLSDIETETCSIFYNEDPNAPLVIYMPGISDQHLWKQHKKDSRFKDYHLSGFNLKKETDEGACQTQHFQYDQKIAKLVTYQTQFNLQVNKEKILTALTHKINTMPQQ